MRSPSALEHGGDRVLREPVDLEVGDELAQLVRDGDVALRVAEPDRRGDVEGALAARRRAASVAGPGRPHDSANSRSRRLTCTGSRACGKWPADLSSVTSSPRLLGERGLAVGDGGSRRSCRGSRARGSARSAQSSQRGLAGVGDQPSGRRASVSPSVSSDQPTASSICFVECGSVNIFDQKNSTKSRVVARASSGGCTCPSPRGVGGLAVEAVANPVRSSQAPTGSVGPMKTSPRRARGARRRGAIPRCAEREARRSRARTPQASITASASSANSGSS